jgi:hypothetical protein
VGGLFAPHTSIIFIKPIILNDMKNRTIAFLFSFCAGAISLYAQPPSPEFDLRPNTQWLGAFFGNGNVTLNSVPVSAGDYVAIFDPNFICSGVGEITIDGMMNATFALSSVLDNLLEPNDGGITCLFANPPFGVGGCENFTFDVLEGVNGRVLSLPNS